MKINLESQFKKFLSVNSLSNKCLSSGKVTYWHTKRMLSLKRGQYINSLIREVKSCRETLNFYRKSRLLGCQEYYCVKDQYRKCKDKLDEIVNSSY